MRALIIKTSSMGDLIHTLPAITDASHALPSITFDWVVEENFVEIPQWHPNVQNIIPISLRRWKKNITSQQTWKEWCTFLKKLKEHEYDFIIDAQGLLKSGIITFLAKGKRYGFNWNSAREPIASLFYNQKFSVEKKQHAILRLRHLFSQLFNYPLLNFIPDYGVDRARFYDARLTEPYLVFLHGTTWETKYWPETYWIQLAEITATHSVKIKLPWGNAEEKARAERIAAHSPYAEVLPKLKLADMATVLANAKAIVAVDTGLGHLAAMLNVPTISLYGPTNAELTGALGKNQIHFSSSLSCSPCLNRTCTYREPSRVTPACFEELTPERVWDKIYPL